MDQGSQDYEAPLVEELDVSQGPIETVAMVISGPA
jgi:hypothetical protein